MKQILLLICLFYSLIVMGQATNYNLFPTMRPHHILDEKLENISFAFGLRILESNYNGPLIRLRRSSDNSELDFYCTADDKIDLTAIDNWRGSATVYVSIWYDQSGLNQHAIQTIKSRQPKFITTSSQPYFVGDGANDILLVQANFQDVTESGKNGSILGIFYATDRQDTAFGVSTGTNRWLTHINWVDEYCYFDPGYCCNGLRSFNNNLPTHPTNPGSLNVWNQYSFVRRNNPTNSAVDRTIIRLKGTEKLNGDFPDNKSCNLTFNLGICAATLNSSGTGTSHSKTRFVEMIMYNTGLSDELLEELEQNQIAFWNL